MLESPAHFGEGSGFVGYVVQHVVGDDAVEAPIGERDLLGVDPLEAEGARSGDALERAPGFLDHSPGEIGDEDPAVGRDARGVASPERVRVG